MNGSVAKDRGEGLSFYLVLSNIWCQEKGHCVRAKPSLAETKRGCCRRCCMAEPIMAGGRSVLAAKQLDDAMSEKDVRQPIIKYRGTQLPARC